MSTPKEVTFRFETDDEYRVVPVNGVWGGPTSRGDIKVDFFHESLSLPTQVTHLVSPDGRMGDETERKPASTFQRTVQIGMVFTADQADSIGRWLQERAREVRERIVEKEDGEGEPEILRTH